MRGRIGRMAMAGLLVGCLSSWGACSHAAEDEPALHLIRTSGTAEEDVAPDSASVFFDVVTQAGTVKEAYAENTKRMATLLAVVKGYGWQELTTQTSQFTVEPLYEQVTTLGAVPRILAYRVTYSLLVKLEGLEAATLSERVSQLLDDGLKHGANNVRGPLLSVKDPEAVRKRLLAQATAEAGRRAQIMAEAAGVKIVRLHHLEDLQQGVYPVHERMMIASESAMAGSAPPIEVGTQTMTVTVSAAYEVGAL